MSNLHPPTRQPACWLSCLISQHGGPAGHGRPMGGADQQGDAGWCSARRASWPGSSLQGPKRARTSCSGRVGAGRWARPTRPGRCGSCRLGRLCLKPRGPGPAEARPDGAPVPRRPGPRSTGVRGSPAANNLLLRSPAPALSPKPESRTSMLKSAADSDRQLDASGMTPGIGRLAVERR